MPETPAQPGPNGRKRKLNLDIIQSRLPVAGRKIAIIGFTEHRAHAPFTDPNWEIWGLNDLYQDIAAVEDKRLRWFQLHDWLKQGDGVLGTRESPPAPRDPNHVDWLERAAQRFPVYLMTSRVEVPDAQLYPRAAIIAYFGSNYFTNSISWMLGMAIMELVGGTHIGQQMAPEGSAIGIWGVDMMVAGGAGSEYGWQRPSCEWLIGSAVAAGIALHLPDESDLLKTAFPYGDERGNQFRNKVRAYRNEMSRRRGMLTEQRDQALFGIGELTGAINAVDHLMLSWMPGDGDFSAGRAPLPNAHKGESTEVLDASFSPVVRAAGPRHVNPGE